MDKEELKALEGWAQRKQLGSLSHEKVMAKSVLTLLSEHEAYKKVVDAAEEWRSHTVEQGWPSRDAGLLLDALRELRN